MKLNYKIRHLNRMIKNKNTNWLGRTMRGEKLIKIKLEGSVEGPKKWEGKVKITNDLEKNITIEDLKNLTRNKVKWDLHASSQI